MDIPDAVEPATDIADGVKPTAGEEVATYIYIAVGVSCGVLLAAGGGIVVVVVVFAVTRKTAQCDKRYGCICV